jgi:xanthine dehydrogenase small subunit
MTCFWLNDQKIASEQPRGLPLLDFIRYHRHLSGTKCGCREGDCGACTVLVGELREGGSVEYRAMTSCLMPLANAAGRHIVTIEGINPPQGSLTPVQTAMVEENGTQCGFCTVGFIMSMTGYCLESKTRTQEAAVMAVDGNICRCTGYKSIERAAARLNRLLDGRKGQSVLQYAIEQGVVPAYFADMPGRLAALEQPIPASPLPSAIPVGGGTDVYVQRPESMVGAPARHLSGRKEWQGIRDKGDYIEIGAATVVSDWLEADVLHRHFPQLDRHLKLVSSTPIRNMATVAGNLANASPIGDLTIWLLGLDARLVLRGEKGERDLLLRNFYKSYKMLAKTDDELIASVYFKKPQGQFHFNFEKVCKRTCLDIASVNTALSLQVENDHIQEAHASAGGVAPVPLYLRQTAVFLQGRRLSERTHWLPEALQIADAEISPISDVRGSAAYKRLLMKQLFHAHFLEMFAEP